MALYQPILAYLLSYSNIKTPQQQYNITVMVHYWNVLRFRGLVTLHSIHSPVSVLLLWLPPAPCMAEPLGAVGGARFVLEDPAELWSSGTASAFSKSKRVTVPPRVAMEWCSLTEPMLVGGMSVVSGRHSFQDELIVQCMTAVPPVS